MGTIDTIMVLSENWRDLRSPKSKFRDTRFVGTGARFVGTHALINSWRFHVDPFKTVATAQRQIFLEVASLDPTWWPDLTWPWAEFFRTGAERMHEPPPPPFELASTWYPFYDIENVTTPDNFARGRLWQETWKPSNFRCPKHFSGFPYRDLLDYVNLTFGH